MSAYRALLFVSGVILVAVLGAFMLRIARPAIDMMNVYSTTEASATGIGWYTAFIDLLPFVLLLLLGFMFIYGVITRRGGVGQ